MLDFREDSSMLESVAAIALKSLFTSSKLAQAPAESDPTKRYA
jgi:hypothetical protein